MSNCTYVPWLGFSQTETQRIAPCLLRETEISDQQHCSATAAGVAPLTNVATVRVHGEGAFRAFHPFHTRHGRDNCSQGSAPIAWEEAPNLRPKPETGVSLTLHARL